MALQAARLSGPCLRQQQPMLAGRAALAMAPKTGPASPTLRMVRFSSTTTTTPPVGKLAPEFSAEQDKTDEAKSSFPKTNPKGVAYWLLGSAASVFGIVVFGGLTRLTESGYVPSSSPSMN